MIDMAIRQLEVVVSGFSMNFMLRENYYLLMVSVGINFI
jgi:hypothetical protein